MINEKPQHIAIKESLLYCVLGGMFVYLVMLIPLALFTLFPPTPPKGITITYGVATPPDLYPFLISFSLFTILGIYLLKKLNFKGSLAHYSLLGFILAIGGGISTGVLENSYYLFWSGNSLDQELFFRSLRENWLNTLFYEFRPAWSVLLLLILTPFTIIFWTSKSTVARFAKRDPFR